MARAARGHFARARVRLHLPLVLAPRLLRLRRQPSATARSNRHCHSRNRRREYRVNRPLALAPSRTRRAPRAPAHHGRPHSRPGRSHDRSRPGRCPVSFSHEARPPNRAPFDGPLRWRDPRGVTRPPFGKVGRRDRPCQRRSGPRWHGPQPLPEGRSGIPNTPLSGGRAVGEAGQRNGATEMRSIPS